MDWRKSLGQATGILVIGLALATAAIALIPAPNSDATTIAVLIIIGTIALMAVVGTAPLTQKPVGGALVRIGSQLDPLATIRRQGEARSNMDVFVSIAKAIETEGLQFDDVTGAAKPRGWFRLHWLVQFTTNLDLTDSYVALFNDEEKSRVAQKDPRCLFRWHATVFKEVTHEAFELERVTLDGQPLELSEQRGPKAVRYSFGPADALRNPTGIMRVVSLAVSVARSDRGGEVLVPIHVLGPTRGLTLKVDASIFKRPAFDVHDRLQRLDDNSAHPLQMWQQLFGHTRVAGICGASTPHVVGGAVDFVIAR